MTEEIQAPYKAVYTSHNALLAMTVEEDLKKAGFSALLVDNGHKEFSVVVAHEQFDNALALLKQIKPKHGEIFSVPKEK